MYSWIKSRIFRWLGLEAPEGDGYPDRSSSPSTATPNTPSKGWLFVLPWEPTAIGGVSRVVNELAASFARGLHYDPVILVLDWDARKPTYNRTGSATVIRLRVQERGEAWSGRRLLYWLTRPYVASKLRAILAESRIAVVNAHYPTDQALELIGSLRALHPGLKTVVSFHGSDVCQLAQRDPPVREQWARELKRASAVTFCSAGLRERLHESLGVTLANASVRRNGATRWKYPPQPRRSNNPKAPTTVLSVGTYHVNKAHEILIGAFDVIAKEHPHLHLVIAGRSGPTLNEMTSLVRTRNLQDRVTLRTDVALDDMGPLYEDALMFVSASRFEPFGISILEAGTAGVPVIATKTDGAREILVDGTDSIIVPTEDVEALARAMAAMAANPELRRRLADNLRNKVFREYQWPAIALEWEALVADPPQ